MRKISLFLCFMFLSLSVFSLMCYGANAPIEVGKAYKAISQNNGKDAFLIGSFPLIHTNNREIVPEEIQNSCQDLRNSSSFYVRLKIVNTENNKEYLIDLKPVTGSTVYRDTKKMEKNANDPFWVLQVPPGNYEVSSFIVKLNLVMQGYHNFSENIIDIPISKIIKRQVNFNAAANQILYIGDYETALETYICLYGEGQLYLGRSVNINLTNHFDTVKDHFLNGADDKTKEKIQAYEFISVL